MPIWKARYNHAKVYRPNGALFVEARDSNIHVGIVHAFLEFQIEFGREPKQEFTVIEIVGVTGDWIVTIFEIIEL